MSGYVLDASVAAKWFLPPDSEPLADESLRILERYARGEVQFLVPDLFWPEIGNILWKAVRLGRLTKESAEEALDSLTRLNIPTSPSGALLRDAFSIAVGFQRTVYDSIYVALAVMSDRQFLTADERLANAVAGLLPVRWLGMMV